MGSSIDGGSPRRLAIYMYVDTDNGWSSMQLQPALHHCEKTGVQHIYIVMCTEYSIADRGIPVNYTMVLGNLD